MVNIISSSLFSLICLLQLVINKAPRSMVTLGLKTTVLDLSLILFIKKELFCRRFAPLSNYKNILVFGALTISMEDNNMKHFCESQNLKILIKVPTCYKDPENPSWIDLILTNKTKNFQKLCVIETSSSDFHKMTVTAIRIQFTN